MIIGITGLNGSGKDAAAALLKAMNFYHVSLSDFLRKELEQRKQKITRDALIKIGNELREKEGADVLARRAITTIKDGENHVFTSLRNPQEVRLLQQRKDFLLVNVVAPEKARLERLVKRNRESDPKTLEDLRTKEKEEKSSDPNAQQLHTVASMAKITLVNDSTIEKLQQKVERLVSDHLYKLHEARPDWDHYFMNIAEQVKLRATCLSARKGAIIVRDKMIISTGYNGTPKGITHCVDGGCLRCTARHLGKFKSGSYPEPCTCCHSEENAIAQAAYNGVSTRDSIIYTTFTPCVNCAKMIINAGIREVVCKVVYPDDEGTKLLEKAEVKLRVLG
ncbi:AAA family ATPase [Candidatus Woesearchaeota archaeon]|nr:AAA family ATPase [Candidatus Woesearchaeota archaeon]